mgnify:CR=1 FL=1|tara:strand:- start:24276 stop:25193 length:918 start_codon:yes stop_codon:yes gene_type:complete
MTIILENGSGVASANSIIDPAFVLAYLTDRNRATENGWAAIAGVEEDAACVAGTDHVERRFRDLFKGSKALLDISTARSTLTFTALPITGSVVNVGAANTYQFVDTLVAAGDVLIDQDGSLSTSIANLISAINLGAGSGTTYHADTIENESASAVTFIGQAMVALSKLIGEDGNATITTTDVVGASWNFATLTGGTDIQVAQPFSFPREDLYDRDGAPVLGIPARLKFAASEYAVRSRATGVVLAPDPAIDTLGGQVTRLKEKVGPLETDTSYLPGTTSGGSLPNYPAADRLLADYIHSPGRVIR